MPKRADAAQHNSHDESKTYLRYGAMIATSMVVMYAVTYLNTYELSHLAWSETRLFMTLLMGSSMAVVMLAYMWGMYTNVKLNLGIILASLALFALSTWLVRSQTTVNDQSYMSAMIPHHSIAILTSENAQLRDVRVCELAKEIVTPQQREIHEMRWLLQDIATNGLATTSAEAEQRAVPTFDGNPLRDCPTN